MVTVSKTSQAARYARLGSVPAQATVAKYDVAWHQYGVEPIAEFVIAAAFQWMLGSELLEMTMGCGSDVSVSVTLLFVECIEHLDPGLIDCPQLLEDSRHVHLALVHPRNVHQTPASQLIQP